MVGELPKKRADTPSRLRVETGRRLVEEEKQFGLCDKFDADGETLALLDVESFTGYTDDGVSVFLRAQSSVRVVRGHHDRELLTCISSKLIIS